jgi:hypothetical protein
MKSIVVVVYVRGSSPTPNSFFLNSLELMKKKFSFKEIQWGGLEAPQATAESE